MFLNFFNCNFFECEVTGSFDILLILFDLLDLYMEITNKKKIKNFSTRAQNLNHPLTTMPEKWSKGNTDSDVHLSPPTPPDQSSGYLLTIKNPSFGAQKWYLGQPY